MRYAEYSGRIPPSVMLAQYASLAARPNMRLSEMLIRIAQWIVRDIEAVSLSGRLLHVANPACPNDVFTDRWPASVAQQNEFSTHLKDLILGLQMMARMNMAPDTIGTWLRGKFGDRVVTKAADQTAIRLGAAIRGTRQSYTRKGRLLVPAVGAPLSAATASLAASAIPARAHSFYGVRI